MFLNSHSWMSEFWKSITRRAMTLGSPARRRQRHGAAPVAALETRTLLTAFVVNSAADNSTFDSLTTLREAIFLSNVSAGVDTITFVDGSALVGGTDFTDGVADTITLSLGEIAISQTVTITGLNAASTIIRGNNVSRIFSITSGDTTLEKLTLTRGRTTANNAAGYGGAIKSTSTGTLTVSQSTLSGNSTAGIKGYGGAIYSISGAVTVSQSTLSGNSTTGFQADGGAIFARSGAVTVSQSTLSGNTTTATDADAGAILAYSGAVTVSESTFSGNSTSGINARGGAIAADNGVVTVSQSTLTGNRAVLSPGGCIYTFFTSASVTIRNSIVAGNTDNGTAPDVRKAPTATLTVSRSLIGDNTGSTLTEAQVADVNGNFIGSSTGAGVIAPLLGPLQNNGGPTFTHAVLTGSLALNSGDNTLIPLDTLDLDGDLNTAEPVPFDQRGVGFFRIDAGTVEMGAFEKDTTRPTVVITMTDIALLAGETSLVTFTFSEPVTGFTNFDLTIANGTLTPVTSVDGGVTWTATFTPTPSVTDLTNRIRLNTALITDFSGNAGGGITSSPNYTMDTLRPTVGITMSDTALLFGETSLVTFTFNEAVTGFTNADLTIPNGTLTPVASANGGITWTATYTPNANIDDTTNVITLIKALISDLPGNAGTGSTSSPNFVIDALPTVVITMTDTALKVGETSLVMFTFSEVVTGFTNADLTIPNGTLTPVASTNGGMTWKATFTPTALFTDATNVIALNNTGYTDLTGNTGTGTTSSPNYTIDTRRPTVVITLADTALKAGETSLVTFSFSEAVTGFTNGDLTQIENGTLTAVASKDGGVTWTSKFTPRVNITDLTNVITLNNTLFTDLFGNAGTGTTSSPNYTVQTRRPTVIITRTDSALLLGETSLFTFTFSEAITGFDNSDLTIENGTLTAVVSVNGGVTWTATFTPTSFVTDLFNKITLNNTGYFNSVGNTGVGTTSSLNYSIDT